MSHYNTARNNKTPSNDTHFKTPLRPVVLSERMPDSDSDSCSSTSTTNGSCENLSLVAQFDDINRMYKIREEDRNEILESYIEFVQQAELMRKKWQSTVEECRRLQNVVDEKTHIISDLDFKLDRARKLLDQERKNTRLVEYERNYFEQQISKTKDLLFKNHRGHLPEEARKQFEFLNNNESKVVLSAIEEVNTTGSLLSDYSYSKSEDDLDVSFKKWRKHKPMVNGVDEPVVKKHKSNPNEIVEISNNEKVRATTTVTVTKDGPITATSVIESVPINNNVPQVIVTNTDSLKPNCQMRQRYHSFQIKKLIKPDSCAVCDKRIFFGKSTAKCNECKIICHVNCKDNVPLPCVPCANTPISKNKFGVISDHTPTTPPMIPALIIHCVTEIENKGLDVLGLYRISGAQLEVKVLQEKLLRARGNPCLKDVDVATLCSVVKSFLRSLEEPLIPKFAFKDLVAAINAKDIKDIAPAIHEIIFNLPLPNRHTLAYLMIHLKKISVSKPCNMPIENLAKIFAITLLGTSDGEDFPSILRNQVLILEFLLNMPVEFYSNILQTPPPSNQLKQTPSTDSLFRPISSETAYTPKRFRPKKEKFFPTPPF